MVYKQPLASPYHYPVRHSYRGDVSNIENDETDDYMAGKTPTYLTRLTFLCYSRGGIHTSLLLPVDADAIVSTPYQNPSSPYAWDPTSATTPLFSGGSMFTPAMFTPYGGGADQYNYSFAVLYIHTVFFKNLNIWN